MTQYTDWTVVSNLCKSTVVLGEMRKYCFKYDLAVYRVRALVSNGLASTPDARPILKRGRTSLLRAFVIFAGSQRP
ncbi:MAG TPA: hypothetical protein VL134_13385 [Leptolyngbya sp.]|jgi:hypothetical protein|nr:hypothetical protein [Leptolyngbya sp.]